MGRKKKPAHLQRTPCTVSLPLDIQKHLYEISQQGLTVSRYIEKLIRDNLEQNTKQTSLTRHVHRCPNESCEMNYWHTNDPNTGFQFCRVCKTHSEYHGIYDPDQWGDF